MARAQTVPQSQTKSRWRALAAKAVVLRYPLFVLAIVLVVFLGQWVEDVLDTFTLEMLVPALSVKRWALVLLTLYMLIMLRLIPRTAVRMLRQVRACVQANDQTFDGLKERMARIHWRTEIVLALLAIGFVVLLFPILNSPLPVTRNPITDQFTFLPPEPLNAFLVLLAYSLVGWAALSLIVNTVRIGSALGTLTQYPLAINVFDTDNVVPFGRLALTLSLAPAGVVLILLFGLGTPTGALSWFAFLLASSASVVALLLPLRGVHRQMDQVKKHALGELNQELAAIRHEVLNVPEPDPARTGQLSNRTNVLMSLRKLVQDMPTWPFRDSVAVSRAILIAGAPLIYTILNELIRIFLIQPLAR